MRSQLRRMVSISPGPVLKSSSSRVLAPKPFGADAPRRHQQMRMIVAIIAVPVRGMNGEVDRYAIALCQPDRVLPHGLNPLLMGELMRQRQNDIPADCRRC